MQRAGPHAEIVDVAAAAGQQRGVFDALDRTADPALHPDTSTSATSSPRRSAALTGRVVANQDRVAMPAALTTYQIVSNSGRQCRGCPAEVVPANARRCGIRSGWTPA